MKTLGILGGGQLAQMLAIQSQKLKIKTYILSSSPQDPAAQVSSAYWVQGDPFKTSSLLAFFKLVDVVTFESEFFSAQKIKKACQSLKKKPQFSPSLHSLSLLQDRYSQKKTLQAHSINTSPFLPCSFVQNTKTKHLKSVFKKLGPFVLKTRMGGYDGYGTFTVRRPQDIAQIKTSSQSFIAERFIPFKRELALLAVRNQKGQVVFSPLVETYQKDSRCLWVKGPVTHKKLKSFKSTLKPLLHHLKYQGVLAFELFDTGKELMVNEVAPRVHNSGHYSLNGLTEDQFTLHLKACFNLPLKTPKPVKKGFAMLNLLGEGVKKTRLAKPKHVSTWWYDKKISRKGRKMGHLNCLASSPSQALNRLLKARAQYKV